MGKELKQYFTEEMYMERIISTGIQSKETFSTYFSLLKAGFEKLNELLRDYQKIDAVCRVLFTPEEYYEFFCSETGENEDID